MQLLVARDDAFKLARLINVNPTSKQDSVRGCDLISALEPNTELCNFAAKQVIAKFCPPKLNADVDLDQEAGD